MLGQLIGCLVELHGQKAESAWAPIVESSISFTKDDGLHSSIIQSITEAADGFIWLGTGDGLVRFDGNTFKHYLHDPQDSSSIFDNRVRDVIVGESHIWIGTHLGFSIMDRATEGFRNFQFESFGLRDSLSRLIPSRVGNLVEARNGDIWMGTFSDAVFRYIPALDSFINYRFPLAEVAAHFPAPEKIDHIISLHQDRFDDQIFWAGTTAGLLEINSTTHEVFWHLYPRGDEHDFLHQNAIRHIYQDEDGKLYLSSWYAGVNIFDPVSDQFHTLPLNREDPQLYEDATRLLRTPIRSVLSKSEQELWISTLDGLISYSTERQSCTRIQYNKEDESGPYGLSFIDSRGRSWLGTSRALHLFDPLQQQFRVFDYSDLNPEKRGFSFHILSAVPTGDFAVLPQAADGIYSLDINNGRWQKFPIPSAYQQDPIGFLPRSFSKAPDGSWTIATPDHIYSLQANLERITPFELPQSIATYNFRCLSWDQAGQLWVGTQNDGLLKWDSRRKEWTAFSQEVYGDETPSSVNDLLVDIRGNVWIERLGGYSVFLAAQDRFVHFIDANNPTAGGIHAFTQDESGRVWVNGINGYLAYGHADQAENGILGSYDLMANHQIRSFTSLQADEQGILWALAENKLIRLNPDTVDQIQFYDLTYGVHEIDDIYGLQILPDGHIVIGGRNKVWVSHRDILRHNTELPIPYISGVQVFQEPYLTDQPVEALSELALSYSQNFFSFDFSALAFSRAHDVQFRYRLYPFEENWTHAQEYRFANFTNVPSGQYTFELQAANNDGLWNPESYKLSIYISTPWWKTYWFWGLVLLALSGSGKLIYNWRINQVRREERLRTSYERKLADMELKALRAQMNPHFVFNSLNSIEYYIISNEPEKASDYLNRFSQLIRLILQNSKSTIVPLQDELKTLKLYIELESIRFDNSFDYLVEIEEGLDSEKIMIPTMLLQPYVENAIWHGLMQKKERDGKLQISIRERRGKLICLVEDNGIGRAAAATLKSGSGTTRKSYGMKITSERLNALNQLVDAKASVKIFDLHDEAGNASGTRVELVIPI